MNTRIVPLVVMLLLCLSLGLNLFKGPSKPKDRMVGHGIESFDIPEMGKPNARFSPKSWEGKVVIVNIFASWCEPCKLEQPVLMGLSKQAKIPLYGISWKDKPANTMKFLARDGNPYTLVAVDENGDVTLPFSMTGVPETFVIGKDGMVRYHTSAALTDEMVTRDILPLVEILSATSEGK